MIQQPTIGSSSIAAIMGISPWAGPWDVWSRMHGLAPEKPDSNAMKRGRVFEEAIAIFYKEETECEMRSGPAYVESPIIGPEPWMHARPDRFALLGGDEWLVEIKSTRKFDPEYWGPGGTDKVPQHYAAQCVWQMAVCGVDRCDLAAFSTFQDEYRCYTLHRDPELEEQIVEFARSWYKTHIEEGTPPSLDGSEACAKALARKWTSNGGSLIDPSEDDVKLAEKLADVKSQIDELAKLKRLLENQMKERIGENTGIRGMATWTTSKPRRLFDKKQLEKDHPELAEKYMRDGDPVRSFRFNFQTNR